jgi:arabinofuranosyltransferase
MKSLTHLERGALVVLIAGLLALVIANAWLSDDAYITFRTVDNAVNGYGLTWNVDERVQVYTHPLWMFLVTGWYAVTGEIFFTSLILSIALSLIAVCLIAFGTRGTFTMTAAAVVALVLSKAFVDYATSGLENPLTHLILAGFILVYLRPASPSSKDNGRIFVLSLLASLGMVNRLDTALLFAPALALVVIEQRTWKAVGYAALGFLPLVAWEAFALFYYGTPFPNTAMAKLNAGLIPASALRREGWLYLYNSLRVDPVTLTTVAVAGLLPFATRTWRKVPLAGGILLYLLYIVRVGGDFMSGRFLTAPLFVAAALLTSHRGFPAGEAKAPSRSGRVREIGLLLVLALIGLTAPYTPLQAPGSESADKDPEVWIKGRSMTDERANYYANTGLLPALRRDSPLPDHDWALEGRAAREQGRELAVRGSVGFYGFFAGPDVHVVDILALGDPLLARLPVSDPNWQIGHFGRRPPAGYLATLRGDANRIEDPNLATYYAVVSDVVRGPLWSPARWRKIVELNLGTYDHNRDAYAYHHGPGFEREMMVVNPTDRAYVYAYVWNNGASEAYLLDDQSTRGSVYPVRWSITPSGVDFEGSFKTKIAEIGPLSDEELLNVGAFFADAPDSGDYTMVEYRYWFSLNKNGEFTVILPGLAWYNGHAPGGFWQEIDADDVLQLNP